jgi:hypothetical protein
MSKIQNKISAYESLQPSQHIKPLFAQKIKKIFLKVINQSQDVI